MMITKVTTRQRKAIESLLTQGSMVKAAEAAGVQRRAVYRWMRDETFRQALAEAEAEALGGLSRTLVTLADKAAAQLAMLVDDPSIPAGTRARACDIILGRLLQLRELYQLEARVSRLEQLNGGRT